MPDTAQYAGDDYMVRLHGLDPFHDELEFLPWDNVSTEWVYPGDGGAMKRTAMIHPPGTVLHEDPRVANRVDKHFAEYGTSVGDVADKIEHLTRNADPWVVTYGAGWYEHEAGSAVKRLRRKGYSRHEAAHLIADLSPQNNWLGTPNHPELGNREEAVRYGREAMAMRHGIGKYDGGILHVTDEDAQRARDSFGAGSTLRPGRYDISHEDPRQWDIGTKEMSELPQFQSRSTRATRSNGIATALGIRHSHELGPKTGPFADNIENPHTSDKVTIDTHMVDAGGVGVKQSEKAKFLSSVGGERNERKNIPIYKGYGQVGMASAMHEVTRRLNSSPEPWGRGQPPLKPLHVQAIAWNQHLNENKPAYRRNIEPMRNLPWEGVFGYNFGHPQA